MSKLIFWILYLLLGTIGAAVSYFLFRGSQVAWMLPYSFYLLALLAVLYILRDRLNRR